MAKYDPLQQSLLHHGHGDDESDLGDEKHMYYRPAPDRTAPGRITTAVLAISLLMNLALAVVLASGTMTREIPETSKFAGLQRNVPKAWGPNSPGNESEQAAIWDATSYDLGNVAIADDEARALGLPRAQRFPWDRSKGIYLINAYHNLHCVATLRQALVDFRAGRAQSSPWGHVQHCLLVLRDEIMCAADDTPRYTGFQPNQKSGLGQVRMCRDWAQLEAYARRHTACWRHVGDIHDPGFRELDRYRFCPDGSEYKEASETKWLHGDWWRKYQDEA